MAWSRSAQSRQVKTLSSKLIFLGFLLACDLSLQDVLPDGVSCRRACAQMSPGPAPGPADSDGAADKNFERLPPPRLLLPTPPVPPDDRPQVRPLTLDEVIDSVQTHFPLLLAILQEQGITAGQLLSAQGAFDLKLKMQEYGQFGTFDSQRVTVGFEQYLPYQGISYFAGYRHSVGDFPIYYGDRKTADGGEWRAGLIIPLLANRVIDAQRAAVRKAEIGRALADPAIAGQRIDFVRAAARAYWSWVAAGQRYLITRAVLEIARQRDRQLEELVRRGAIAEIERVDNQRVIIEREARLIAAERVWQQASIALSLYLRNEVGLPVLPAAERLPAEFVEPVPLDRQQVLRDIEVALQQRPELQRLRLQRERALVDLQLARNQTLPQLNVGINVYQDVGAAEPSKVPLSGTELDRAAYLASVTFDVPLQRRDARGRIVTAQAAITQLAHQEQYQRDRIVTEVQDAASALERSYELVQKARQSVQVARRVEAAERERFFRGQGSLLILNLRELITAEASFAEVDALADYHRALADYRAALGTDAAPPPAP
ncbi:MAG: multidrug transporter [Pirellulaceae bacterium]|nr:MAG: multidrug transporter [Pirellulaceae bacterium]